MQRYFGVNKDDKYLYLEKSDYHHLKKVMRCKDGDFVEVVVDKKLYLGCIENVKLDLKILIKKELEFARDFIPKVNLIIPLLKESKMDIVLQKACEMGVHKISIIALNRCVVKVSKARLDSKFDRWMRILKEASEQSYRSYVPEIEFVKSIDELKKLEGLKIVCSTLKNLNNVKNLLTSAKKCDTINVVIGPEGGFELKEEKILNEYGFQSVTLGSRIMRVETVPLFIMSIINYEYME